MIHDFISIYSIALLATGAVVGFACGLLGIGGGFMMVPVQIWALTASGTDPTIATRVAFGTSLATILPTALRGCRCHDCMGAVLWRPAAILGIFGLVGAFFGGTVAAYAPATILKKIFGVVVLIGAFRMLYSGRIQDPNKEIYSRENLLYCIPLGLLVGILSGLCGIGGGVLLIPAMVVFLGFDMRQAIGTSSAAIALNAFGGMMSYIINGWGLEGLPPYSLGYVNAEQFVLLTGASILSASWGARATHLFPAEKLKRLFAMLMIYVGLHMIGAFDWIGL